MTQLTGVSRTIFLTVMGLNWDSNWRKRSDKVSTIGITKKGGRLGEIQERYYYSSLCSRIWKIWLYSLIWTALVATCLHSHIFMTTWEAWFPRELRCLLPVYSACGYFIELSKGQELYFLTGCYKISEFQNFGRPLPVHNFIFWVTNFRRTPPSLQKKVLISLYVFGALMAS